MPQSTEPWENLFSSGGSDTLEIPMWLLRRRGRALLLLPRRPRLAATGLELYPAQTPAARLAKAFLRRALRLGLGLGLSGVKVTIGRADPLAGYMRQVAGAKEQFPLFAMLAGNPQTDGQRCIFLLFDSSGNPSAVVKAGAGSQATRLIEHEQSFLSHVPSGTPGIPILRSVLDGSNVRAFATDFFPGHSPPANDWPNVEKLLNSWVTTDQTVALSEFRIWRNLEAASGPALATVARELRSVQVRPTIFHGDFAPWNIKVRNGIWTLVDWERGELAGIPGWDWFHFVVQTSVLVERANSMEIIRRLEHLFKSDSFVRYAHRAGIAGIEQALAMSYFEYCLHVLKQTEGLSDIRAVAEVAKNRWLLRSL